MNPLWLMVGLEIGDRIREPLRDFLRGRVEKYAAIRDFYRFIDSLPTKGGE